MSTKRNRREVLKLIALGGVSLYFPSCWNDSGKSEVNSTSIPESRNDTIKDTIDIAYVEKQLETEDVIYFRPNDSDYNSLNQGFNLRVPKSPSIIAVPNNVEGVSKALKFALRENLKVAVKSGGHSFENYSSIDEGMQINLSLLNKIHWETDELVWIEPACLLKELYDKLLPKGRLLPAGSCGTVGVGGLTLGGGYGFFSRKYGLTCDHLLEAEFVDGTGEIHHLNSDDRLMWALKGGGNGNFGIVTKLKFKTRVAPKTFTRYRFKAYKLDKERTKELLKSYFEYSSKLSNTCFAAFVLNYKTMVVLVTNYGQKDEALNAMIEKFKEISDKSDIGKPRDLAKSLVNYYGVQHPIYFKNASAGYYDGYSNIEFSIDAVLDQVFLNRGLIYQINTLGGNIANPEYVSRSCYPHREMPYLSELQAYWEEGKNPKSLLNSFSLIQETLYKNGIRKQYRNYPNINFRDWETAYYGESYNELQELKSKYDPNDLFTHAQSVKLK